MKKSNLHEIEFKRQNKENVSVPNNLTLYMQIYSCFRSPMHNAYAKVYLYYSVVGCCCWLLFNKFNIMCR